MCFGCASPSTSEVATDEPGCSTRNVPTDESRGSMAHSCSCPHTTRSNHGGIFDSGTHLTPHRARGARATGRYARAAETVRLVGERRREKEREGEACSLLRVGSARRAVF